MFKDKHGNTLTFVQVLQKIQNRIANIILESIVYVLHLAGFVPIHHFRRLIYRVAGMHIGKGSTIHMYTRFYDPRNIAIGEDSVIGEFAVLDGRNKLTIGNHVAIASEVMIYNSEHNIHSEHFDPINAPVTIDDYVFIGPRAIIMPGITIGKGAVVAAAAVVTHDVPAFSIVAGVPAKNIGERRDKNLSYRLGRARWFR